MAVIDGSKEWKPKTDYGKEKIHDTKMLKIAITEMDWRYLKSKASLIGVKSQDYAGQVLREHLHKH